MRTLKNFGTLCKAASIAVFLMLTLFIDVLDVWPSIFLAAIATVLFGVGMASSQLYEYGVARILWQEKRAYRNSPQGKAERKRRRMFTARYIMKVNELANWAEVQRPVREAA